MVQNRVCKKIGAYALAANLLSQCGEANDSANRTLQAQEINIEMWLLNFPEKRGVWRSLT